MLRLTIFLFLLLPFTLHAAPLMQAGFRTLGINNQEQQLRLDLAVWYPTRRSTSLLDYGDWKFNAARNAPILAGQHPLILLSHDTGASRFSMHELASTLAQNGYIVAAPTHPGDNLDDMDALFTLKQIHGRAKDLQATLDLMLADSITAAFIDPKRIAVLGVGPGGTAALLLAGAQIDGSGWESYCARLALLGFSNHGSDDLLYCSPWASERMDLLAQSPDLEMNFLDPRIKAVCIVAPWFGMLFSRQSLARVQARVMLLALENDKLNPQPFNMDIIRKSLPQAPEYHLLQHADSFTLFSPCSQQLKETWPEICSGVNEKERKNVQKSLSAECLRFFQRNLLKLDAQSVQQKK